MAKKNKYEVRPVGEKHQVFNIEDDSPVGEEQDSKKQAETLRKEYDADARQAVAEAKAEEASEDNDVEVANDEKVTGITKSNYKANLARADELKQQLTDHFQDTGGFPSHRYIQQTMGFNISTKAIIRHKRNILKALGKDPMVQVPTTSELPRAKKAVAVADDVEADVEL